MPHGVIIWFNPAKGYGYIAPADGTAAVFLNAASLDGFVSHPGQPVTYETATPRGFIEAAGPVRPA